MLSLCSSSLFDYVPHLRFHFYTHPKSNEKSVIPSDEIVMSLKILRFYATVPPHYLSLSLRRRQRTVRHTGTAIVVFGPPAGKGRICITLASYALFGAHRWSTELLKCFFPT